MRPSTALHTHRDAIRAIALSHRVTNVRVFGSVVHGEDTEGSDLDILVEPTPETTLMDIAKIQLELGQLLGIPVDVLTPKGLPAKFRDQVIAQAQQEGLIRRDVDPRMFAFLLDNLFTSTDTFGIFRCIDVNFRVQIQLGQ